MALDQGRTRLELTTAVEALGYSSANATQIYEALNAAQRRICGLRRWQFMEQTTTGLALTANDNSYDLDNANIAWHDNVIFYDTDGLIIPTEYITWEIYRDRQFEYGDSTGPPEYWTLRGRFMYVLPTPDLAYAFDLDVVNRPTELAADGDRTDIPGRYSDAVVWGAVAWLATRQRDDTMRVRAEEYFSKAVNAMVTAYSMEQRASATQVRRSRHWNDVGGGVRYWAA